MLLAIFRRPRDVSLSAPANARALPNLIAESTSCSERWLPKRPSMLPSRECVWESCLDVYLLQQTRRSVHRQIMFVKNHAQITSSRTFILTVAVHCCVVLVNATMFTVKCFPVPHRNNWLSNAFPSTGPANHEIIKVMVIIGNDGRTTTGTHFTSRCTNEQKHKTYIK